MMLRLGMMMIMMMMMMMLMMSCYNADRLKIPKLILTGVRQEAIGGGGEEWSGN
jgi:hypothetical protein